MSPICGHDQRVAPAQGIGYRKKEVHMTSTIEYNFNGYTSPLIGCVSISRHTELIPLPDSIYNFSLWGYFTQPASE